MVPVRQRIEELLAEIAMFRKSPESSDFVDRDQLLTFVENELEDCMTELLNLPIQEHRSLLDRVIVAVDRLGTAGQAIEKLLKLFMG